MPIGIHVLGPKFGESIILQMPDGQVGVIDSYCNAFGQLPVLDFLRQRFNVTALLFLAVTHPHADHCMGIKDLIKEFPITELWVFDSIQFETLRDYYHKLLELGERDAVERDLHAKEGTVFREILELRKHIKERRRARPKRKVRLLRAKESFNLCNETIGVRCLTPGNGSTADYRERLASALHMLVAMSGQQHQSSSLPAVNQNQASGALLIEYGETRILLLADAESSLWQDWLSERGDTPDLIVKNVHLIKVGHHGSANGYLQELYASACVGGSPLAVVTPFSRGRSPLPSKEGIGLIRQHIATIVCTNRMVAEQSTGHSWQSPGGVAKLPELPRAWAVAIKENPQLIQLLAPPYGDAAGVSRNLGLPPKWVYDLAQRPELLRLLHPQFRRARETMPTLAACDEFLVSVYFDDKGQEDTRKRYVGPGAGLLR